MQIQPIIERLRANAGVFRTLCAGLSAPQARWKPTPEKWSILEVVNHLADEEVEDFRTRVDITLHRAGEEWPVIDPPAWALERKYNESDLDSTLARFLIERERSASWLEGLVEPDWDLRYEHPVLGALSAGQVMTSWLAHDHIHIRQINRLQREYLVSELSKYPADYAGEW